MEGCRKENQAAPSGLPARYSLARISSPRSMLPFGSLRKIFLQLRWRVFFLLGIDLWPRKFSLGFAKRSPRNGAEPWNCGLDLGIDRGLDNRAWGADRRTKDLRNSFFNFLFQKIRISAFPSANGSFTFHFCCPHLRGAIVIIQWSNSQVP